MEIDYIMGPRTTEKAVGIASLQREIHQRLKEVKLNRIEYTPLRQALGNGIRAIRPGFQAYPVPTSATLRNKASIANKLYRGSMDTMASGGDIIDRYLRYPYLVKKRVKKGNVKHMPSHEFAYLFRFVKLEKVIITLHHLIPYVVSDFDNESSFFWRLNVKEMKKADRIITVSNFSKNEIVNHVGYPEAKIAVIYHGVDYERFKPAPRDEKLMSKYELPVDKKLILYVGSEHPRKNVPTLIKAFSKLKKVNEGVKLVKVGNPAWKNEREKLLRLIYELGLESEVLFLNYVPEEDLPKLYNAADLFVLPSLYEGFGVPLLEAMASGTPVVASNSSSIPELVGDAGVMVDPNDFEGLAQAMYKVLTNVNLSREMIQRGLRRANLFTWEKAAEQTLEVYKGVESLGQSSKKG